MLWYFLLQYFLSVFKKCHWMQFIFQKKSKNFYRILSSNRWALWVNDCCSCRSALWANMGSVASTACVVLLQDTSQSSTRELFGGHGLGLASSIEAAYWPVGWQTSNTRLLCWWWPEQPRTDFTLNYSIMLAPYPQQWLCAAMWLYYYITTTVILIIKHHKENSCMFSEFTQHVYPKISNFDLNH